MATEPPMVERGVATKVTEMGQVTIPKNIRDRLGIAPGSLVEFSIGLDGRLAVTLLHAGKPVHAPLRPKPRPPQVQG